MDRSTADRLISGGSWSAYWYNGIIVSSEIARGLDIFELVANPLITQNEIDAAKTVKMDYWNTQEQRRFVWPPSFAKARAFVDQLERSKGLSASRISTVRTAIDNAEKASGAARRTALTTLSTGTRRRREVVDGPGEGGDADRGGQRAREVDRDSRSRVLGISGSD